jgi:threonine dehydrogenase-like Zn-dependent dehydrogenase
MALMAIAIVAGGMPLWGIWHLRKNVRKDPRDSIERRRAAWRARSQAFTAKRGITVDPIVADAVYAAVLHAPFIPCTVHRASAARNVAQCARPAGRIVVVGVIRGSLPCWEAVSVA